MRTHAHAPDTEGLTVPLGVTDGETVQLGVTDGVTDGEGVTEGMTFTPPTSANPTPELTLEPIMSVKSLARLVP